MELIIFVAAFGIMLTSLAGLLFTVARAGNWVEENLVYLNTFAAGVFLVVSYNILVEAFEFSSNNTTTILAIIGGFAVFFLAEYFLPETHCHHDDEKCIHFNKDKRKAWKVLISDGVHNIGDGILLVPVFLIDLQLGIIATIGIIIHELVQEVAEFFVLKQAGYTTLQALERNFLVSSTIILGVFLGIALTAAEFLIAPLIGFAAGGFLHIVFVDLLPLTYREARERKKYFDFLIAFLFGIALIAMVNKVSANILEDSGLSGHGHVHTEESHVENHDDHDHDEKHDDESHLEGHDHDHEQLDN